jgi:hypothetical protein
MKTRVTVTGILSDNAMVSGNTGGGVYVNGGSFIMSDSGGEVSVRGGNFTKTGGVIYGSNETNQALRNSVKNSAGVEQNGRGAAVYVDDGTHRRETTVDAGPMSAPIFL